MLDNWPNTRLGPSARQTVFTLRESMMAARKTSTEILGGKS
jgi:hypothetical protein